MTESTGETAEPMDPPERTRHDGLVGRTVGDLLAAQRRAALCGRGAELADLRAFIGDGARVLCYLHGPGGVGKSTLLSGLTDALADEDRHTVVVDCADLEPTVAGFLQAVETVAGGPLERLDPDAVLVVDRFELLEHLSGWLWRSAVPSLPSGSHVVVAGRRPPPEAWLADPAFRACARVVACRNLDPRAAAELSRARGVADEAQVERLVRATHGHPLALVIATDEGLGGSTAAAAGTRDGGILFDHPDLAARLLGVFLESGVSKLERDALHICGHARRVDRSLLAHTLEVDDQKADELLAWLRSRPYAESHPDGLAVHDVVRDALDRDLRWRDREAFVRLHERVRQWVIARLERATSAEHHRYAADLLYLHRGNPSTYELYSYDDLGTAVARPARIGDESEREWLLAACALERRRGLAAYSWDHEPDAITVFEDAHGERSGAYFAAWLPKGPAPAAEHDPVLAWALRAVAELRPIEDDEAVLYSLAVNAADPGALGGVSDQVAASSLRDWQAPRLGWVIVSSAYESGWAPLWEYIGFARLGSCVVAGVEIGVWARDFSRSPFPEWLAAMGEQELDEQGTAPPPVATPIALSHAEFGPAVRAVLRDLRHPVALRGNPLLGSRLATPSDDPAATLVRTVTGAVALLRSTPRGGTEASVLERTYLQPAGSQERIAELLHISLSTYRRHLASGLDALEDCLWDWELHGRPAELR